MSQADTEITLTLGPRRAVVAPFGASLRRYFRIEQDGSERDIVWGYSGKANKKGGQGDVLIPFPGRIRDGLYRFEYKAHQLDRNDKDGPNAIHGFARSSLWEVEQQSDSSVRLRFAFDERTFPGYPFGLESRMEYELTPTGLEWRFTVRNTGSTRAPVGAGFHPYFTLGNSQIDEWELLVPAAELMEFAPNLLPTGKVVSVAGSDADFRKSRRIGAQKLNHCLTRLIRDADGIARARLRDPRTLREVTVWMDQAFAYVVVYTGDTILSPNSRRAVAIEPMTCATDAFNHEGWGTVTLEPGHSFGGRFGVEESVATR